MNEFSENTNIINVPNELVSIFGYLHYNITSYQKRHPTMAAGDIVKHLINNLRNLKAETREFLRTHTLDVIHAGNSINIMVQNIHTRHSQVISICKYSMASLLPPVSRSNLVQQGVCGKKKYLDKFRTISLINYYPNGSVNRLYENTSLDPDLRYALCAFYISKMANSLITLQKNQVFFPDAKITNWILDKDELDGLLKPIIIDDKSLRSFDQAKRQSLDSIFIHTPGYWPNNVGRPLDAEKIAAIHAYILGANIYYFLTGSAPPHYGPNATDFNASIFTGKTGEKYKLLIQSLMNQDHKKRMSLEQAIVVLRDTSLENDNNVPESPDESSGEIPSVSSSSLDRAPHGSNETRVNKIVTTDLIGKEKFIFYKNEDTTISGEALKNEIFKELERQISKLESTEELRELSTRIKGDQRTAQSAEYRILSQRERPSHLMFKEPDFKSKIDLILDMRMNDLERRDIKPNEFFK